MNNKAKNILIIFLLLIITVLLWMLFDLSYGRYCKPIIREEKFPATFKTSDSSQLKLISPHK